MDNKTIVDGNFIQFRKFADESEDKTVVMTYLKNEKTNKKGNPYHERIAKMTTVEFTYGKKYSEEVKSANPEYEFKGAKAQYEKFAENDILEKDAKGELSLGVVDPHNTSSEYYLYNDEKMLEKWDTEKLGDVHDFLPQRKAYSTPSSGVVYRRYKYKNIQKLSIGNTDFVNPDFLKENEENN